MRALTAAVDDALPSVHNTVDADERAMAIADRASTAAHRVALTLAHDDFNADDATTDLLHIADRLEAIVALLDGSSSLLAQDAAFRRIVERARDCAQEAARRLERRCTPTRVGAS